MHKTEGTMLIAALCLMCMPIVFGGDCAPFVGPDFSPNRGQTCVLSFCAGSCTNRYCSILPGTELDQSQFMCIITNLYFVVGFCIVAFLLLIFGIITCCCKSLCECFSLCCPGRSETHVTTSRVAVTSIVRHQPMMQIPFSAPATGYVPVANPSMYAGQRPPPYPGADNMAFQETP